MCALSRETYQHRWWWCRYFVETRSHAIDTLCMQSISTVGSNTITRGVLIVTGHTASPRCCAHTPEPARWRERPRARDIRPEKRRLIIFPFGGLVAQTASSAPRAPPTFLTMGRDVTVGRRVAFLRYLTRLLGRTQVLRSISSSGFARDMLPPM